jgi:hypothetical protein
MITVGQANPNKGCWTNRKVVPRMLRSINVIARSEAMKQSTLSLRGEMDCFAWPAMTAPLFEN